MSASPRLRVAAAVLALPALAAARDAPVEPARAEAEREAARALERTLVQKGGLLVPTWGIEVVPAFSFAYSDGPALVASSPGGAFVPGARSETFTGAFTLRVGLPLATQVEATAPVVFARLTPGGDPLAPPAEATGIGDVRVGFTWHALGARRHVPDVLLGAFWKSRTGRTAFDDPSVGVALGTGIERFGATLALVKAIDPVVLLATGTYAVAAPRWIPEGWLEAGDELGGSMGALLAVSPGTSLSFGLEATFTRPVSLNGISVYRSDRTAAVFRVGVSTVATRRGFFQVSLGVGLTSEVPRFEVALATPIRF